MTPARGTRYVIVANPTAGGRGAGRLAERVDRELRDAGAASDVQYTSVRGEAETITRAELQRRPDGGGTRLCIAACGGDGTVQEVVNALRGQPDENGILGIVPAGRCNDFASAFGIAGDAHRIAQILMAGHTQQVDLGRVNDRFFCTVAALGFDAAVSRFVDGMRLPLRGTAAYLYGVLRVLLSYAPVDVRLNINGETLDGPVFLAASANTPCYGGRMRIAPDAHPGDGLLDLCLISPLSRLRVIRLLRRVIRGEHRDLPEVRLLRAGKIRIESAQPREIWADGEYVARTPATIESVKDAVEMAVPASAMSGQHLPP